MEPKNLLVHEYLRVSKDRSGRGKSPDQQHDENAAGQPPPQNRPL